jgi:poly(A) polymerase Pap1
MTLPDVFHIQSLHNTTSSNDSPDPSIIDPNEIDTMKLFQIPDGSSSKLFTLDDSILMGLDEASVRSINGVRVAELILELIPNRHTFCQSLRTIKEWAFVHGLYSNVLGYLGGIQWAILVAYICKV